MENFTANDLDKLFTALSDELKINSDNQTKHELYLTGGGAMMLSIGVRRTTTDIDVIFGKGDKLIHDCAIKVGESLGIDKGWCNDMVVLSSSFTPAVAANSTLYKSYGCLDVYTVNADLLLCMKLISFRDKDMIDIEFLIDYLESHNCIVTINKLNEWYAKYYEDWGKTPKFKKQAITYIKETFQ